MITAKRYSFDVPANSVVRALLTGSFLRITSATGLFDMLTDGVNLEGCAVGDGFEKTPMTWVLLKDRSGAVNTVQFVVSQEAFLNSPTAQVLIGSNKNTQTTTAANTAKAVTNASAQLLAANSARQYLLVQNKDAAGVIYLNFGAGAATAANGLKIPAGGSWEWDSTIPTLAVQAIGDIANNPNIVVVEG